MKKPLKLRRELAADKEFMRVWQILVSAERVRDGAKKHYAATDLHVSKLDARLSKISTKIEKRVCEQAVSAKHFFTLHDAVVARRTNNHVWKNFVQKHFE